MSRMLPEIVVVMFTDQVGSTARTARRTPSERAQVNREQTALTLRLAQQCRGSVLKDTGDGAAIRFASCVDAVQCGSLIQQAVEERNVRTAIPLLQFEL